MFCAQCQFENRASPMFCSGCGARTRLGCASCGTDLLPDSDYCDACGRPVAKTPAAYAGAGAGERAVWSLALAAEQVRPFLGKLRNGILPVFLFLFFLAPQMLGIGQPLPVWLLIGYAAGIPWLLTIAADLPQPTRGARAAVAMARGWRLLLMGGLIVLSLLGTVVATSQVVPTGRSPAEYRTGTTIWVASVALLVAGVLVVYARPHQLRPPDWRGLRRWDWLAVGGVTLLAFVLRIVDIVNVPYPFTGDESYIGFEATRILSGEAPNLFHSGWAGYPYMFFLPTAIGITIFGQDIVGVRAPVVLLVTAAVPLLYLLGRRWFGSLVGLLAAALFATWDYTVHYGRLGTTHIGDAVVSLFTFLLLDRALDDDQPLYYLGLGLVTAVTCYAYVGARLTVALALLYFAFHTLRYRRLTWARGRGLLLWLVTLLVVAGPEIQYFREHPDSFVERINQTGIVQTGWLANESVRRAVSPLLILAEQFFKAVLVFVTVPPSDTSFYPSHQPLLNGILAGLLVFGLTYSALRLLDGRYYLLTLWFWAPVGLGVALTLGVPMVARMTTAAPPVCLLIAVGLVALLAPLRQRAHLPAAPTTALAFGIVAVSALLGLSFYFGEYTPHHYSRDRDTELGQEVGLYLRNSGADTAYLGLAPRLALSWPALRFFAPKVQKYEFAQSLQPDMVPALADGQRTVFVVVAQRQGDLDIIQARYPNGQRREFSLRGTPEPLFYAYELSP